MTDDNVSSLSARRAITKGDARMWTPAELIDELRKKIESGEIKPTKMMVLWWEGEAEAGYTRGDASAGLDTPTAIAMLSIAHTDAVAVWSTK